MVLDLSGFSYFVPVFAFLLVATVVGAILVKAELLGKSKWAAVFVALFIASLFISFGGVVDFVATLVPWAAVLFVSLFFILLVVGFVGKDAGFMTKGIGVVFVILLGIAFLFSGFAVFSHVIVKYIPGPFYGQGADVGVLALTNFLYSGRVIGAIVLVAASALISWILVKGK